MIYKASIRPSWNKNYRRREYAKRIVIDVFATMKMSIMKGLACIPSGLS